MKFIKYLVLIFLLMQPQAFAQQSVFVTTDAPQELTNKTMTSPVLKGTPIMDPGLIWNMGGAASSTPATVGPSLPTTCTIGNEHFLTSAPAGQNKYGCTAPNSWTLMSGGGGPGGTAVVQVNGFDLSNQSLINFVTSPTIIPNNPAAGQIILSIVDASITAAKLAVANPSSGQLSGITTANMATTLDFSTKVLSGANPLYFDGTSADSNRTRVVVVDPTAARDFTIPNNNSVAVVASDCNPNFVRSISALGVIGCASIGAAADIATNVFSNGVQVGSVARAPNFSTDFTVGEDAPNNRFNIALAVPFAKAKLPTQVVYNDASTAYGSGTTQDFTAARMKLSVEADPGSPLNSELWINTLSPILKYRDTQASPVTHQLEVRDRVNVANGYAGLDVNSRIAKAQAPSATVYTDAAATYTGGGLHDYSAALVKVPNAAGYRPTLHGHIGIDNTANVAGMGINGVYKQFLFVGDVTGSIGGSGTTNKLSIFTASNIIGNSAYISETPGVGPNITGQSCWGTCGTNDYKPDPTNITGHVVRALKNLTGDEVVSIGTLTPGHSPAFDSNGAMKDGGPVEIVFGVSRDGGLLDTDDRPKAYPNQGTTKTLTQVKCWTDTGTSIINLQRDDGTPANILASNLTCTTAGATTGTFVGGENIVANNQNIDFVMVTAAASGIPTKVTVSILANK